MKETVQGRNCNYSENEERSESPQTWAEGRGHGSGVIAEKQSTVSPVTLLTIAKTIAKTAEESVDG